jgi:hypothetical protein
MLTHSANKIPLASCPLSAGYGNEAYGTYEGLDINYVLTGGRKGCQAYELTGNSAIPYIYPGSVVVVDPSEEPRNGDIVATHLNGLNYVKVLESRPKLRLVSPNTKYEPQDIYEHDSFHILGVVVGYFGVPRPEFLIKKDFIYTLMDLSPTDRGLFYIAFEGDHGDKVEVKILREDVVRGIKMATKALKQLVTNTIKFPTK